MNTTPAKFCVPPSDPAKFEPEPFRYSNVYAIEPTTGPDRLAIAPSDRHVELMLRMADRMSEPFRLLYILTVSRGGQEPGRYQYYGEFARPDVTRFLDRYSLFLEGDGRHHLWLQSLTSNDLIVYDNHNLLYAYGDIPVLESALQGAGLKPGSFQIPAPHMHGYRPEFDDQETAILSEREWIRYPLVPEHDEP